jgi:hypothetical protein
MPIDKAFFLFACGLAFSLSVQTVEFLGLAKYPRADSVWRWSRQADDSLTVPPGVGRVLQKIFSEGPYQGLLWVRLGAALSLFYDITFIASAILMLSSVLLLIRWRGAFNGGSDAMTLICVIALCVATTASPFIGKDRAAQAALLYVAAQAVMSYFTSGAIKILNADWRSGRALTHFLDQALYGPLPSRSPFRIPIVAQSASWAFILWEITFPLSLLNRETIVISCGLALLFHLLVFRFFGLNRFVFAWVTTFPALLHCSEWLISGF